MIRETTESVILKTDENDGHGGYITLEPGTKVIVDVVGIRKAERFYNTRLLTFATDYNAQYFPEPEDFRPSRWYGASENDMTMFSLGPRAC